MCPSCRLLTSAVLLAACGQSDRITLDPPGCEGCTIVLDTVVMLDLARAPASPEPLMTLVHLPNQSWLIARNSGGASVLLFDIRGRYRGELMRRGRGPGEAWFVTTAWMDGDTLWTWDAGLTRCTAWNPESLTVERDRECSAASAHDVVVVDSGIITQTEPRPRRPLRFVADDGTFVAFGPDTINRAWDIGSIAPAKEGVWYTKGSVYRLERWVPGEQEPREVIERTPAWWRRFYPEKEQLSPLDGPIVWSIWQQDGIIWTASYVSHDPSLTIYDVAEMNLKGRVHVIIEALTTAGDLIASGLFDLGTPGFTNEGLLFASEPAPEGHIDIGVYRPSVVVPK